MAMGDSSDSVDEVLWYLSVDNPMAEKREPTIVDGERSRAIDSRANSARPTHLDLLEGIAPRAPRSTLH